MNLSNAIIKARDVLLSEQHNGYWQYPLESDCTIPAEYILLQYFLNEPIWFHKELVAYIWSKQNSDGGWSLYEGGESDLSCTIKCYFALKMSGYVGNLVGIRDYILRAGGIERANIFTKILLAIHGQLPWEAVPWTPMELILLPKWFPFNIHKVAYWTRCVMIPLSVIISNRITTENAIIPSLNELFKGNPGNKKLTITTNGIRPFILYCLERTGNWLLSGIISKMCGDRAITKISKWLDERANGIDGLGGIFPAMAALLIALPYLKISDDRKDEIRGGTQQAIRNLIVLDNDMAFVQPCISPVWDTAISMLALNETLECYPSIDVRQANQNSTHWLMTKQVYIAGDWNNDVGGFYPYSGWAFQNRNDYYPDVDDTAMVLMALEPMTHYKDFRVDMAKRWLRDMRSSNGGYGAFDVNNDSHWINDIPFADHGAMLDPPTADVSGRVLAATNTTQYDDRLVQYLLNEQNKDGLWWGRWGTNYLWGTWSAIQGLSRLPEYTDIDITTALRLTSVQMSIIANRDGGYGESNLSYETGKYEPTKSNAFHTALAILIMCEGINQQYHTIQAAVDWLLANQLDDGGWVDTNHNAPGFPKVFYLKYHGYSTYFPLWALAKAEKVLKDK